MLTHEQEGSFGLRRPGCEEHGCDVESKLGIGDGREGIVQALHHSAGLAFVHGVWCELRK